MKSKAILFLLKRTLVLWALFCYNGFSELVLFWKSKAEERKTLYELLANTIMRTFEQMGPVFIKALQVAHTSPFIDKRYTQSFNRVCDRVQPESFDKVQAKFDLVYGHNKWPFFLTSTQCVASGSIAQIYQGVSLQNQRKIAIKVLRSNIRERLLSDLYLIVWLTWFLSKCSKTIRRSNFHASFMQSFDFFLDQCDTFKELENVKRFQKLISQKHNYLYTPIPLDSLCREGILVTEWEDLSPLSDLTKVHNQAEALNFIKAFVGFSLLCLMQMGVYHADLHAGNVYYSKERDRIILLDFGLVRTVQVRLQQAYLQWLSSLIKRDLFQAVPHSLAFYCKDSLSIHNTCLNSPEKIVKFLQGVYCAAHAFTAGDSFKSFDRFINLYEQFNVYQELSVESQQLYGCSVEGIVHHLLPKGKSGVDVLREHFLDIKLWSTDDIVSTPLVCTAEQDAKHITPILKPLADALYKYNFHPDLLKTRFDRTKQEYILWDPTVKEEEEGSSE